MRREAILTVCVAISATVALVEIAAAQSISGRQIRLVVPFPAGGPTDIVARPVAQALGDAIKSTVVIDNRGGAGGSLGADVVAKSAPDGRTLLMATVGTHAINPSLYKKLPYDAERDFTPIALVAMAPVAIVVHPSQPVNNVAELVAIAKRMPGKLNYGSAGSGTPGHLTGEMFKSADGIDLQHVPYRGSAPALTDLLGGQLQLMFDPLQSVLSHVQGGKLRAIAVSSKVRSPSPERADDCELGYSGFETTAWWGVFAPAKLPDGMAEALGDEIEKVVRSVAFHGALAPLGVLPTVITGRAFAEFQTRELAKWSKAVRDSGATAD